MHSTILLEDCDGISVYCSEPCICPLSYEEPHFRYPHHFCQYFCCLSVFCLFFSSPFLRTLFSKAYIVLVHGNSNRLFHANINPFEIDTAASLLQNIKWNLFRSLVLSFTLLVYSVRYMCVHFIFQSNFGVFYFIVWVYRCTDVQCAINSKTFRFLIANAHYIGFIQSIRRRPSVQFTKTKILNNIKQFQ